MKTLVIILLTSTIIFSQKNPDGDDISFHFTPFFIGGSQTYPMLNIYNQLDEKEKKIDDQLNFNLMVKIPFSKDITISPFYETFNYAKLAKLHKYGVTFSFYLE